jgi:cytochrome c
MERCSMRGVPDTGRPAERGMSRAALRRCAAAVLGTLAVGAFAPAALAEGNADAGKKVFARCALCHTAEPGKNRVGPSLFGLIGRHAGSAAGYSYSPAMHDLDKVWEAAALDEYLSSPKAMVPGTKMIFPGLSTKQERDDVIAFLATLR